MPRPAPRLLAPLLALGALCGCRASAPTVRDEGMVRLFDGERVVGQYVSPNAYEHYLRAQLAALAGQSQEAADELRRAITSDGVSAYLRTRLGEELTALGRLDEARESLEAALRDDPAFAEAWVDLGRIALRLGDGAAAEASFRRAFEMDRGCEDAYLALASLYRERGDTTRADGIYRTLVERVPQSATAHLEVARAATAHGDPKTAESELRRAIELSPNSIDARLALGQLLLGQNRLSEAEWELRAGYERSFHDPRAAELLITVETVAGHAEQVEAILDGIDAAATSASPGRRLSLGWLLASHHRAERAAAIAAALVKAGGEPAALLLHGAALAESGRVDEGLAALRRIGPDAPEWTRSRLRLGRLLLDEGRLREATDELTAGLPSARPDGDALTALLAEVRERAGDRDQARRALESALRARPESSTLAYALAQLLRRAGEWERAVEMARGLLKRSPDNAEALNFLGWSFAERGVHLGEAQKLLERALGLRPASGEIADSLGWLYFKLDRIEDAGRLLERAGHLLPDDPEVLRHLGDLYARKSDRARALAAYRRALQRKPDEKLRHAVEEQLLFLENDRVGSR